MQRVLGLAVVAFTLLVPSLAMGQGPDPDAIRVTIDDVVSQGTTLHVQRGLEMAEERGIPLLIQLDTPGGLVQATLDIDDLLAQADVPVLTYVGPGGGTYAASAGTFILLMGHQSGMADGATIGSAQAVQSSPDGATEAAGDKVQNFLVERIRSIAERNGRDQDLAEQFITENLNMNATDALETGIIDVIADDAVAFLTALDGRTLIIHNNTVGLQTGRGIILDAEPGALAHVVDFIGTPQITLVLILAGTYGVVFGITNAGTYVPEVLGALLLILGFIGLGLFATSTAGVILLILALLFFIVEVFTPTHGVLTGAGVVALIFAAIFLVQEPLLPPTAKAWFIGTGIAMAITMGGLVTLAITLALRSQTRPPHDSLYGALGTVAEALAPTGRIIVNGEVWYAETDMGPLPEGTKVVVLGREGLRLHVSAATDEMVDAGATDPKDAP